MRSLPHYIGYAIFAGLITSCTENKVTESVIPQSNLFAYIDAENPDPLAGLGNAVIEYLIDNPEWYDNALEVNIRGGPISLSSLSFQVEPEIVKLAEYFAQNSNGLRIIDNYTIVYRNLLYELELEKYRYGVPADSEVDKLEFPSFALMLDPDLYNDEGEGMLWFKDFNNGPIRSEHVTLTKVNVSTDLYFLTLRDITPDTRPIGKITSEPGTYLVLDAIKLNDVVESGAAEVEVFTGANLSALYYNRVTSHKFDGSSHIDAAGDVRVYPDANYDGNTYYADQPIALCRLSDDFEQRIITIEDDYDHGRLALERTETGYNDWINKTSGIWSRLPNNTSFAAFTRFFRLMYDQNSDDIALSSEIRGLTISNTPSSWTWVGNPLPPPPEDVGSHVQYRIKKLTY